MSSSSNSNCSQSSSTTRTFLPAEHILYNEIKSTIGSDPSITIPPMCFDRDAYYISVICDDYEKSVALSTVLIKSFNLPSIKVRLTVYYKDCSNPAPIAEIPKDAPLKGFVRKIITVAFTGNPYFARAICIEKSASTTTSPDVLMEFKALVVQFFANSPNDYFGNINEVPSVAFKLLIHTTYYNKVFVATTVEEIC